MSWRVAQSLLKLRAQIDAAAPKRSKVSDGTIGDGHHSARNSDHNPWVRHNGLGIVTALDITHDPANGVDCFRITTALTQGKQDPRIKYIIWNKQIWNPAKGASWNKYTGANPHTLHMHISVKSQPQLFDSEEPWVIGTAVPHSAPKVLEHPLLVQGSTGAAVRRMKAGLTESIIALLNAEGEDFGPNTKAILAGFQQAVGLKPDGKAGQYTWKAIGARGPL